MIFPNISREFQKDLQYFAQQKKQEKFVNIKSRLKKKKKEKIKIKKLIKMKKEKKILMNI